MAKHHVFVCTTCDVDSAKRETAQAQTGKIFYKALYPHIEHMDDVVVHKVACLGGCETPCNISMSCEGKGSILSCGLKVEEAAEVAQFIECYTRAEDKSGKLKLPADTSQHLKRFYTYRIPCVRD